MNVDFLNLINPLMTVEEKSQKKVEEMTSLLFLLGHFSDEGSTLKNLLPELALKIIQTKTAIHSDAWMAKSELLIQKIENANSAINKFRNIRL